MRSLQVILTTRRPGQVDCYSTRGIYLQVDDKGTIRERPTAGIICTCGPPVQFLSKVERLPSMHRYMDYEDYHVDLAVIAYSHLWGRGVDRVDRVEYTEPDGTILSAIRRRRQFAPGKTENRKVLDGETLM